MKTFNIICASVFLLFTFQSFAASNFSLDNISQQEIDNLTEELGADWVFTTVSSAKPTGDIIPGFGFEVGFVVGATDSPNWYRLISEEDPATSIDKLPHLNFIGTFSIKPLGLTVEFGFIPEKSTDNASIKNTALAAKWTFIDNILYQFAVRGHMNSNELSFSDSTAVAGGNAVGRTAFETSTLGVQFLAGMDLLSIFEPYAGLGFVKSSTDTSLSANITVTDASLSANRNVESSHSSLHFVAGIVFDLSAVNLGVEYMNALGTSRIAGKFSINI